MDYCIEKYKEGYPTKEIHSYCGTQDFWFLLYFVFVESSHNIIGYEIDQQGYCYTIHKSVYFSYVEE